MSPAQRNARRRELYAQHKAERLSAGATRSERAARRDRAKVLRPEAAQASRAKENQRKSLRRKADKLGYDRASLATLYAMPYPDAVLHVDMHADYRDRYTRGERGIAPESWTDLDAPDSFWHYHPNADGTQS